MGGWQTLQKSAILVNRKKQKSCGDKNDRKKGSLPWQMVYHHVASGQKTSADPCRAGGRLDVDSHSLRGRKVAVGFFGKMVYKTGPYDISCEGHAFPTDNRGQGECNPY